MKIIEEFLNPGQWIPQSQPKSQIVLHHTVSSTVSSTVNWWNQTKDRVGVAYIIDKNGDIWNVFPDDEWAYHLGKGTTSYHNKKSIGIEIINEGPLIKKNKQYYWFDGKAKYSGNLINYPWRNYEYWPIYTDEQFLSLSKLLKLLLLKYNNINKELITHNEYDKNLLEFNGIISHCNVRLDKTDTSPALDKNLLSKIIKSNKHIGKIYSYDELLSTINS